MPRGGTALQRVSRVQVMSWNALLSASPPPPCEVVVRCSQKGLKIGMKKLVGKWLVLAAAHGRCAGGRASRDARHADTVTTFSTFTKCHPSDSSVIVFDTVSCIVHGKAYHSFFAINQSFTPVMSHDEFYGRVEPDPSCSSSAYPCFA